MKIYIGQGPEGSPDLEILFDPAYLWALIQAFPTPHLGFVFYYLGLP